MNLYVGELSKVDLNDSNYILLEVCSSKLVFEVFYSIRYV